MTVVAVEFVEPAEGLFGKVVARTVVRGMTAAERAVEVAEMLAIVGEHCMAVEVEEMPAVR